MFKRLGYIAPSVLTENINKAQVAKDELVTINRILTNAENGLSEQDDQLKKTLTTKDVKYAMEGSVATAVDGGVIHAMAPESFDTATVDDQFLTGLSGAFLSHANTCSAITRFTIALVEQEMNEYLREDPIDASRTGSSEYHQAVITAVLPEPPSEPPPPDENSD